MEVKFPFHAFHPFLPCLCAIEIMRFLFHALCFLVFPPRPVPLTALDLPCRLVAVADALLAMTNIDLLLFLPAIQKIHIQEGRGRAASYSSQMSSYGLISKGYLTP
jgi:hypothetical protein